MTIVSYAQNFEDVMLWRALKNIENGFYIDVGANDPVIDSVSFVFYQRGWKGIHIEPTQQYSDKLRSARPDEQVEQVAIGMQLGPLFFYEFEDTGLSTADSEIAEQHKKKGFSVTETKVDVLPLSAIFNQCHGRSIHWLKIDVEGLEKDVLESWGEHSARPWILVIESTLPLTTQENFQGWENLVLEKGYIFAYFDGLNRFYVHETHQELLECFTVPPNVFDEIILSGLASNSLCEKVLDNAKQIAIRLNEAEIKTGLTETRAVEAETRAVEAETRAVEAETRGVEAETRAVEAETRAVDTETLSHALINSTSWRVTAPLRYVGDSIQWFRPAKIKDCVRLCLKHAAFYITRKPRLKRAALHILNRLPGLKLRLTRITTAVINITPASIQSIPTELEQLTPRARQIYYELQAAIKHNNKESH